MLIISLIIITVLFLLLRMVILRFRGKSAEPVLTINEEHPALTISVQSSMQPCLLEVDDISEREVDDTLSFILREYGSHLQQHLHLSHHDHHASITVSPGLPFADVANLVNQFAWSSQGRAHRPKARYRVVEMLFGDIQLNDAEVEFFVADEEEVPSRVGLRIPSGSILVIDLGRDNIIETRFN